MQPMSNNGFQKKLLINIPYIALTLGCVLFTYGSFHTFDSSNLKEFISGLGKTILASGIFALLLKTIQFMGVFKEELSKVVYDTRFLKNRKDLPEVWEGVSKVVFKNKFPSISNRLLKDITEVYFPTGHGSYYDELEHFISYKYTDATKNTIELTYTVYMNIICDSPQKETIYEYTNVFTFRESKDELIHLTNSIKVDGDTKIPIQKESTYENQLTRNYKVRLTGKEKYKIERREIRNYFLDIDNIMYFTAIKITNNIKIDIVHPDDLDVIFKKCGTINEFELKNSTTTFKQYKYSGIIYPQQGYIFTLNKKTT